MKYFALNSDGLVYDLCDCGDIDAAEESAQDMGLDAVWLIDEIAALQWAERIIIGARESIERRHAR